MMTDSVDTMCEKASSLQLAFFSVAVSAFLCSKRIRFFSKIQAKRSLKLAANAPILRGKAVSFREARYLVCQSIRSMNLKKGLKKRSEPLNWWLLFFGKKPPPWTCFFFPVELVSVYDVMIIPKPTCIMPSKIRPEKGLWWSLIIIIIIIIIITLQDTPVPFHELYLTIFDVEEFFHPGRHHSFSEQQVLWSCTA